MKPVLLLFLLLTFTLFLALTGDKDDLPDDFPMETGAYPLVIPHKFGPGFKIPENNPLTQEGVTLGRLLFYEKRLSIDNTISCATCHQQAKAFTDGQARAVGISGRQGNRSAMSLVNLLWARRFFWDGRASNLEEQALSPIQDSLEMHQPLDKAVKKLQQTKLYPKLFKTVFGSDTLTAERIAKALAQFERTLISSDSRYDKHLRGEYTLTPEEKTGMDLFMTHPMPEDNLRGANCGDCHGTFKTFMEGFHNNGLESQPTDAGREKITQNEADRGKFRAPSLRNIALTAPYMHDGRFQTLTDVLDHYNDHIQGSATLDPLITEATNQPGGTTLLLTPEEKKAVLSFLHTLTDSTFVTNPEYANPFPKK